MSIPAMHCPCDRRALSPPIPSGARPCVKCHGLWLPGPVVESVIGHVPRVSDDGRARAEPSLLECPHDGAALLALHCRGVEVDHCLQCHGVWLDRGELMRLTSAMQDDWGKDVRLRRQAAANGREFLVGIPDALAQEAVWSAGSALVECSVTCFLFEAPSRTPCRRAKSAWHPPSRKVDKAA
jgi:Zn-finger nucleic acid-binding protein